MHRLIDICLIGVVVALAMAFADTDFQDMNLLVHARAHVGAFAFLSGLIALSWRLWTRAAAAAGLALVALIAPVGSVWSLGPAAPVADQRSIGAPITILSFNMAGAYRGADLTLATIARADADVVVLAELWRAHAVADALKADYPHIARCPRDRLCSVAIFSRYPLTDIARIKAERGWADILTARLLIEDDAIARTRDQAITLVGFHADWPLDRQSQRFGLEALADAVNAIDGMVIAAGDLNATPWSPEYRTLVRQTGLRTLAGYRATWPHYLGSAGVPIDHVFVRGEARIRTLGVIDGESGSDHRPVFAEINLQSGPLSN